MSKGLEELEDEIINLLEKERFLRLNEILQHFEDHPEIKKSLQVRAKKDKIRRILDKSPKIEAGGRTRKKSYYIKKPDSGWPSNRANLEVMMHNELLGGYCKPEDIAKSIWDKSEFPRKSYRHDGYIELEEYGWGYYEGDQLTPEQDFVLYASEYIRLLPLLQEPEDGSIWKSFELSNNVDIENPLGNPTEIIKIYPHVWFENEHRVPSSYFGFQGPNMMKEIITNISEKIDQINDKEIKGSNVKSEIEWLKRMKKSNKKRHSNKYIFTLALLHLNRSLKESIDL